MNINKILQHPTVVHQDSLLEICKPLNKLNIIYFSHVHIDKDNNMSTIGLSPKFFQEYFKHEFQQYDLHQAPLTLNNHDSYIIWDTIKVVPSSHTKKMQEIFNQFNHAHTFSIIRTFLGAKDYYHFSAKISDDFMNNHYLQILQELYLFINYFSEKVQQHKELKVAYQIKFPIKSTSGGFSWETGLEENILQDFHNEIFTERFYFDYIRYLTKKEKECIYWISQGKIEEEIGIILQITKRTVKEHIKNIKLKLNCKTLFQLGMMYNKLIHRLT